jgi:hypothetical protein
MMSGETDPGAPSASSRRGLAERLGQRRTSSPGDLPAIFVRKVVLDGGKSPLVVVDALRRYASAREYTIRENVEGDRFTVVVVDRNKGSSLGLSATRVFFGGYFELKRIRITVTGVKGGGGGLEVTVRGDALLSEWNEVDRSPRRVDVLRCERIFEEVVARIGAL